LSSEGRRWLHSHQHLNWYGIAATAVAAAAGETATESVVCEAVVDNDDNDDDVGDEKEDSSVYHCGGEYSQGERHHKVDSRGADHEWKVNASLTWLAAGLAPNLTKESGVI
jgi:hypothetical protein